jgi:AcrR family transcriptional regulator
MTRTYVKNRRADNQAETRQRIVEAAVALHGEIGPTATSISMIAERAGVQRHTVYAHFADELSLLMACSGSHLEHHPPPSPSDWEEVKEPALRLTLALTAVYAWFARNKDMLGNVFRDAEHNAVLQKVSDLRFGSVFAAIFQSLAPGLGAKGKSMLGLALSFYTWRTLTGISGVKPKDAVALMVHAILGADTKQ